MMRTHNHVNDICDTTVTRLPKLKIDMEDRIQLIWDLENRVLNANIGKMVRLYRQRKLTRVNDVTFRKELAVKCETKHM